MRISPRILILVAFLFVPHLQAQEPRVLPLGQTPNDVRLQPLKDLDGYFPFTPPASSEAWENRADALRIQMRVALGLWPEPTKTPLNPTIHGRIDRGDYTVEKVYFESMPGLFVTGNLYRPTGGASDAKHPGVLCPYGHWPDGRFMDTDASAVKRDLASGAEQFENAAHSPLQARCVQLARMGCVVFHYDMLGKADSLQIPEEIIHGFKKQRPEMNSPENWGLFSPQAEAHLQSVMGLQTWNSVRSLDFLAALPDVDPSRLAMTGASGGGTQTMVLAALDPRLTVAFPAVMVSTAMQGGCTCENASLLRVRTGNIEFAALFAPKPMGMTAANDWTKEMETKGFPELKQHWTNLGAPENVQLTALTQFPHNYNAPSRAAMYALFNKHLRLNLPAERLQERDFPRLTRAEMSVWDAAHPAPQGGPDFERKLLKWWKDDAQAKLSPTSPTFVETARPAWESILGRTLASAGDVSYEVKDKSDRGNYWFITGLVRNDTHHEELPTAFFHPKEWDGATVLLLSQRGKAGLFTEAGTDPAPEVRRFLDAGVSVIGADLFDQGEFLKDGRILAQTPTVKNPREAAAYTYGYNDPVFAQRVHDLLTLCKFIQTDKHKARFFGVVAFDDTGLLTYAARAMAPGFIGAMVAPNHPASAGAKLASPFAEVNRLSDPNFLPGSVKYGDLTGLWVLGGPADRSPAFGVSDSASRQTAVDWMITQAREKN